jgi:hypothetical protein
MNGQNVIWENVCHFKTMLYKLAGGSILLSSWALVSLETTQQRNGTHNNITITFLVVIIHSY